MLSFYFRDEVLPYYAGDHERARALAANDFKYWELMRRAVERGLRVFDYGRSKRGTGSFDFKKNWGFEPQPLHYEYLLLKRDGIPQNNPPTRSTGRFIALWRRLPRPVANAHRAVDRAQPGLSGMEPLLYLVHRIPYPPNKGDKIRSYQPAALPGASGTRSTSACSSTSPEDLAHVDAAAALCADACVDATGSARWRGCAASPAS